MDEINAVIDEIEIICKEKCRPGGNFIQPSDIGVVTPYKLQCRKIKEMCNTYGFGDVTVGTAEVFQGQEKPVIIISTVRTAGKLGFVSSEQVRLFHCILFGSFKEKYFINN